MSNSISKSPGIYIIFNTKNGKVYIGQAQNLKERWQRHKNSLRLNSHRNIHLQRAWNKDGEKVFKFKVLEYCSLEQLDEREQHYLNVYMPKGMCYNIAADVRATGRGLKRSPESIEKWRIANAGRKHSDEAKAKVSAANKGKILSADTKAKMSASHMGIKSSPETRAKMSLNRCRNVYEITSPEGHLFQVRNLNQFCKENGLSQSKMSAVSLGQIASHKGWKARRIT